MRSAIVGPMALAVALAAVSFRPADALAHAATSNTVLFDREIVRILDTHCVMCHMQGGPSFPLETYEETWLRRAAIHHQTLARHMPPWAAVPGFGEFANANRLTLREQRFIVSWVEGLGPRNDGSVFLNVPDADAAAREPVRAAAPADAWSLGEPDLEVALLPGEADSSSDIGLQHAVVETGLAAEALLAALEFLPDDRRSLRAAVFTLEETGQWLATWTPWYGFRRLQAHIAYRLPAGARIKIEMFTSAPLAGLGRLGLHFENEVRAAPSDLILSASAEVSGGEKARLRAETTLPSDSELLALWPRLPQGIESVELAAVHPDGKVEILLHALEVPFDWPTPYIYQNPVSLPAGSRLAMTAYVSNAESSAALERIDLVLSAVETSP